MIIYDVARTTPIWSPTNPKLVEQQTKRRESVFFHLYLINEQYTFAAGFSLSHLVSLSLSYVHTLRHTTCNWNLSHSLPDLFPHYSFSYNLLSAQDSILRSPFQSKFQPRRLSFTATLLVGLHFKKLKFFFSILNLIHKVRGFQCVLVYIY